MLHTRRSRGVQIAQIFHVWNGSAVRSCHLMNHIWLTAPVGTSGALCACYTQRTCNTGVSTCLYPANVHLLAKHIRRQPCASHKLERPRELRKGRSTNSNRERKGKRPFGPVRRG